MEWIFNKKLELKEEFDKYKVQQESIFTAFKDLKSKQKITTRYPPGHFYSPLPNIEELKLNEDKYFPVDLLEGIQGIDLNVEGQKSLLEELSKHQELFPYNNSLNSDRKLKYNLRNEYFAYADGAVLFSMICEFQPKKIIEVGSGFSSALIIDTNKYFFNNEIECSFIEPHPERLLSLLDQSEIKLFKCRLEDIDSRIFASLKRNDILFIDSSHVVKIGNDVNHLLGEILPLLNEGVIIHFHDIFYPFEYPKHWYYNGMIWNETYFVRSFLQYNYAFEILLWNDYMSKFHTKLAIDCVPSFNMNSEGASPNSSLWIRKKITK
ncbi:MAG: class I SAM-dependent methyltransferase [Bacillota bacterium]